MEILIAVAILGVLAAAVIPRFTASATEARRNSCADNVALINTQAERWYFVTGSWPDSGLSDIGADPSYFPTGIPTCPVDGSAYKLHPVKHRVQGHAH